MPPPAAAKVYHIVHVDRLPSIVSDGCLWSDARMEERQQVGTSIGMTEIKRRRRRNPVSSHPGLSVGDCVPFYFCPRSVMLFVIYKGNHPDLSYRDGQGSIVHLEADLHEVVGWAAKNRRRWAFTLSNAGSSYFDDYADLAKLEKIDWGAVEARDWQGRREGKQAEFLVETSLPWGLIRRVGLSSARAHRAVRDSLRMADHRPRVEVRGDWYY